MKRNKLTKIFISILLILSMPVVQIAQASQLVNKSIYKIAIKNNSYSFVTSSIKFQYKRYKLKHQS